MIRPAILTLLVVVLALSTSGHRPPIAVEVRPRIMIRMSDLRIKALVDPKPENRSLVVTAWCEEEAVRSSGVQLNGADAPYASWFEWRDMVPCRYGIVAEVEREDGSRLRAETSVEMPEPVQ